MLDAEVFEGKLCEMLPATTSTAFPVISQVIGQVISNNPRVCPKSLLFFIPL